MHLRFCSKQKNQNKLKLIHLAIFLHTSLSSLLSNQINLEEISLDLLIFLLKQLHCSYIISHKVIRFRTVQNYLYLFCFLFVVCLFVGAVVVVIVWYLDFQLPVQILPITTNVVRSNPVHGEMYSIQYYVIKFVSGLRQVGGFLRFPPPIKLKYYWKWR